MFIVNNVSISSSSSSSSTAMNEIMFKLPYKYYSNVSLGWWGPAGARLSTAKRYMHYVYNDIWFKKIMCVYVYMCIYIYAFVYTVNAFMHIWLNCKTCH